MKHESLDSIIEENKDLKDENASLKNLVLIWQERYYTLVSQNKKPFSILESKLNEYSETTC